MTWLRLVENLNRIQEPDCIGGWLAVTCSRESMRVARIAGLVPPLDVSGDSRGALRDDTTEDPVDAVVRHEEWRLLRESVEALPDRQRRLVTELLNGCRHIRTAGRGRRSACRCLLEASAPPANGLLPGCDVIVGCATSADRQVVSPTGEFRRASDSRL